MAVSKLAINGGKPVRKTLLPYGHQWLSDKDIEAVTKTLQSDWLTQGSKVDEFEAALADYVGAKYAVTFSNGTAALHGACFAAGLDNQLLTEGITSAITFAASANCIEYFNNIAVLADIDKDTLNIDVTQIDKQLSGVTKIIIPVDFTGLPADLDSINILAELNECVVIEDASHALGATYKGCKVGSISDMTVFSFHPVKIITTGEGGAVTTNNPEFYERLKLFRTHGITKDVSKFVNKNEGGWYHEMQELGYNYRLTDFQCALGLSQLQRIDLFLELRKEIVEQYDSAFRDMPELTIPKIDYPDRTSAWHLYVIQLNLDKLKVGRREIYDALRAEGIGVQVHYIPVHCHPYYQGLGYKKGDYPVAEAYYERCLSLPLFPKMNEKDVSDVIQAVNKVLDFYRKGDWYAIKV
jgi:UDP-4-amino-4,6-dideoxy-N-acetyl-beta-L-altrosamine transaminase